ncbi:uncharacterized protein BO88DRAFT_51839 [Aspergillus vadensis CBS 113365]|uniref:Uncharacterized protein n=1 Tax=Aspergillus vadensis (strain CBS 113365 / IMI 142717 / IBT 24658) TaxID=1448311 RepID=A0A319C058_ASPVC|nr:hypothetical protein BO88DRAFT_51839 [Aspergillus vadensis CBS 113365]PYH68808.1 hypothetical protein BO88DRAFT_51839 [Aspergillus vadensis CBS 113365]
MSSGPIGAKRSCGDSDTIIGCHSFFFPGHHGSFFRLRKWELLSAECGGFKICFVCVLLLLLLLWPHGPLCLEQPFSCGWVSGTVDGGTRPDLEG